jgi:phosphoglycerol transferase MdoB-like AlkP superfamily enzyme
MKAIHIGTWISIVAILAIYVLKGLLSDFSETIELSVINDGKTAWGLIVGSISLVGILLMKVKHEGDQKKFVQFLFIFTPFLYVFSILIYLVFLLVFNSEDMKIMILISTLLNILFFGYLSFSGRKDTRALKS